MRRRDTEADRSACSRHMLLLLLMTCLAATRAHAAHCSGCVDGQPTETCPEPSRCGYQPILCVDCMDGMSMPTCPNAAWCVGVDCRSMQCVDRQPTPTCSDPGVCGYQPLLCTGCVPGEFRFSCPRAEWCAYNQTTSPCMDCMVGMVMPFCPNVTACQGAGAAPLPPPPPSLACEGCMVGMPMPHCPYPDLCDTCVMSAVFSASGRTCLLFSAWHVDSNAAQWLLVIVGIWLLAFLREGLTVYRTWAALRRRHADGTRKAAKEAAGTSALREESAIALESSSFLETRTAQLRQPLATQGGGDRGSAQAPATAAAISSTSSEVWDSVYYLLSLAFGYLLMLLIMTYNVWVCLLVLCACAFWHFLLHWCLQHRWKPALVQRTQRALARHAPYTNGSDSSSQQHAPLDTFASASASLDVRAAPTSGEHCCDDIMFDD